MTRRPTSGGSQRDIPADDAVLRALAELVRSMPSSGRLGHSSPEIAYRVYAYREADDEAATRAARASTLAKIIPDAYPMWTGERGT